MEETVYEVFARKKRGDPLSHVGYLQAPDEELARIYAWKTYDEENWFEMCVIPRSAVIPVNRAGGGFATHRDEAGSGAADRPRGARQESTGSPAGSPAGGEG